MIDSRLQLQHRAVMTGWLLSLTGLLPLTLTGCGGDEVAAGGPGGRPPSLVRIGQIEKRAVTPKVTVVGSVVPVRTSIVASGANGVVQKYHVEVGDYVSTDAPLSELRMKTTDLGIAEARSVLQERKRELDELEAGSRPEDIAEARAKLKVAEALMKHMVKKLTRSKSLFDRGAINQEEFDDALEKEEASQQAYLAGKAMHDRIVAGPRQEEIDRARARFEAQQNQVDYLEAEKDKRTTRAPFDGFVVKEHTYRGQWLSKGDPVVTLARMDKVDVIANVDQQDELHIRLFDEAKVRINGIAQRDWTGKIVAMVPRSEWQSGSRGFPVKVRLQNSRITMKDVDEQGNERTRILPVLKEGMMAEVTFRGQPLEAILVPKNALVRTSRGTQVFLFNPLLEPKWEVRRGEEMLGNVNAISEDQAVEKARIQYDAADDVPLTVKQTGRPKWEITRTSGETAEVIDYLEADSKALALEAAGQKHKLPQGAELSASPQLGTVQRIVVELGISDGEMVQVFSKEATPGAFVVTEGAERLQDYQDVQLPQEKIAGPAKNKK